MEKRLKTDLLAQMPTVYTLMQGQAGNLEESVIEMLENVQKWKCALEGLAVAISEEHSADIRSCYVDLVKSINPNEIMDYMMRVIGNEKESILNIDTSNEKMRQILKIASRSEIGYYSLLRALCLIKHKTICGGGIHFMVVYGY